MGVLVAAGFLHFPTIASALVLACEFSDAKLETEFLESEINGTARGTSR